MKICIVVENHPLHIMGGAQYQAHLLASELATRKNVEVYYLGRGLPAQGASLPYGLLKIGSAQGVRRRAVAFDALELWRALHRIRPDAIYQRMKQSYTGICGIYARRFKIPLIFHVAHEMDLDLRWNRRGRISGNLPFDIVESVLGNIGVRRSSDIIVQTSRQATLLATSFSRQPTALIRNFHPLPNALPVKTTDSINVLWVANFKRFKQPELFVDLAEKLKNDSRFKFWMVGRPYAEGGHDPLMQRVSGLPNIQYFGERPIDAVNELMNSAHVFVNTSVAEGFPNTFIQAWARGAVVVSLNVDSDEGMEVSGTGFCVQSSEKLAATLSRLADHSDERAVIVDRAFEYAQREHALRNAGELADLIIAATERSQSGAIPKQ
jgi:glycosyltransferase involved in cell wall biosynthesis